MPREVKHVSLIPRHSSRQCTVGVLGVGGVGPVACVIYLVYTNKRGFSFFSRVIVHVLKPGERYEARNILLIYLLPIVLISSFSLTHQSFAKVTIIY